MHIYAQEEKCDWSSVANADAWQRSVYECILQSQYLHIYSLDTEQKLESLKMKHLLFWILSQNLASHHWNMCLQVRLMFFTFLKTCFAHLYSVMFVQVCTKGKFLGSPVESFPNNFDGVKDYSSILMQLKSIIRKKNEIF